MKSIYFQITLIFYFYFFLNVASYNFCRTTEGSMSRHSCSHHPEVTNITLRKKLPTCLHLSFCFSNSEASETVQGPRSRMPTAANLKRACTKAQFKVLLTLGSHSGSYSGVHSGSNSFSIDVFDVRSYVWDHLDHKGIPNMYAEMCEMELILYWLLD